MPSSRLRSRLRDGTFMTGAGWSELESGSVLRDSSQIAVARGESQLRVLPNERGPNERGSNGAGGTPLPDSKSEQPPVVRRAEVVAFALVALLVICVVAVLYAATAFFLPVVMAFVVGTMLSPAAGFLERHRIPRSVSAVLIVTAVGAGAAFIVGLISSPLMEWSNRLPELGSLLKDKLHVFDLPLALWQQLRTMLGGSDGLSSLQMPKFDWVQPAIEFLSPTFSEFLLFFAILVLFIASWRDLRRALIMTFADHATRLRTLRILNEIEASRRLSDHRDPDQSWCRCSDRHHLRGYRHAQPGRARRAGRDLELLSDHRPGGDVRDPDGGRRDRILHDRRGPDRPARFCRDYLSRRPFHYSYHHRPPARAERARCIPGVGVLDLAVG